VEFVQEGFRGYGFSVVGQYSPWDRSQYQGLPDPMNWHKRHHSLGTFCTTTTPDEADAIPRVVPGATARPRSPEAALPSPIQNPELLHQLFSPGSAGETAARLVVEQAEGDEVWKRSFLDTATSDWIATLGTVNAVPVGDFLRLVLPDGPILVRANLAVLVGSCRPARTPKEKLVSFTDYLRLMLRFGPIGRVGNSIKRLTQRPRFLGFDPFGGFVTWFQPNLSHEEANAAVNAAAVGTWLIRLSSIPNEFTLYWRATECFPPLVCRLRYDGLREEGKVYAAVTENEDPQFAGSWDDLLVKGLGLRIEDAFKSPEPGRP
jgi:hypothetical protein